MAPAVNRRPPGQDPRPVLIIFITTRLASGAGPPHRYHPKPL